MVLKCSLPPSLASSLHLFWAKSLTHTLFESRSRSQPEPPSVAHEGDRDILKLPLALKDNSSVGSDSSLSASETACTRAVLFRRLLTAPESLMQLIWVQLPVLASFVSTWHSWSYHRERSFSWGNASMRSNFKAFSQLVSRGKGPLWVGPSLGW